jgi:murein endopeptidase
MKKEVVSEREEAIVSMISSKDNQTVQVMKFKGEIRKLSICALLDSGSTHFFVNPMILKGDDHRLV